MTGSKNEKAMTLSDSMLDWSNMMTGGEEIRDHSRRDQGCTKSQRPTATRR
jgi:hypothetical protein